MRKVYLFIPLGWVILIWGWLYLPNQLDQIENKVEERYKQQLASIQVERNGLQTKLGEEYQRVKSLQTELESLRKQVLELEKQNAELARIIAESVPVSRLPQPKFIRGKITAINPEANILILSIGKQDGVSPGAELEVLRDNQVIARFKIDVLEDDWSSAHSLEVEDLKEFQVGDEISTQIK